MKETLKFCQFIEGVDWTDLPAAVTSDVRYRVLDWFGCAVSALKSETGKNLLSYARKYGSDGKNPIIGVPNGFSMEMASFVNAALGHVMEYDDVSKTAIGHPGCVVIPAALNAALEYNCSMGEFFTAIVCGYETYVRLGRAVCPSHYESWHTTGTIGAFAAAITAAKIAKMTSAEMQNALGIVATTASGLISSFGTEAKVITVGNAVRNGLVAVHLSKAGINGPKDAFENPNGFLSITSRAYDPERLLENIGSPFLITTAGYKIHASCGHTHTVLDALVSLIHEEKIGTDDIVSMDAEVYSVAGKLTSKLATGTELEAKFSLPYCMAVAAIYGEVSLAQFTDETRRSSAVMDLAKTITIKTSPMFDEGYPAKRTCKVTIHTTRGNFEKTLDVPVQIPDGQVLVKKFRSISQGNVTNKWMDAAEKQILYGEITRPAKYMIRTITEVTLWQAV